MYIKTNISLFKYEISILVFYCVYWHGIMAEGKKGGKVRLDINVATKGYTKESKMILR